MTESEPTSLLATELELVAPFYLAPLLAHFGTLFGAARIAVRLVFSVYAPDLAERGPVSTETT
jgi:hypothetical protein